MDFAVKYAVHVIIVYTDSWSIDLRRRERHKITVIKILVGESNQLLISTAVMPAQPELLHDIAKRCHEGGIHVMLESCGHANYEMFAPALPYIDAMYFDVKHIDPEIHRQLTGADNRLILENLHKIAAFGVPIIVRTPVIPGYNDSDENIMGIAEMLRSIGRVESYELLAYHKLGESKYHALGRTYPVAEGTEPPSLERMRELVAKANSVLAGSGKTCFYVE